MDRRILNRLQEEIPFEERPWRTMARELGLSEDRLLQRVASLKKGGIIRRIGAVFSPGKIDFVSTLVGVKTAPGAADRVAKRINLYPEVTHNYRRSGGYNIWFTLVCEKRGRIAQIMRQLKKEKAIEKISEFPTLKLFKINVRFSV